MKVRAKYPIGVGQVLIPKGETGRIASLEEMKKVFPAIDYNAKSSWVGVVFRDFRPILVDLSQVQIFHEST